MPYAGEKNRILLSSVVLGKIEKKSLPAEITEELLADIVSRDEGIRKRASDEFARMGSEAVQPLFEMMRSLDIDDMFMKMSVEQTITDTLGKLGQLAIDDLSDALSLILTGISGQQPSMRWLR